MVYKPDLPSGIYEHAWGKFEKALKNMYYPDVIILPLTPEAEVYRDYLFSYEHDVFGKLLHQSIGRYGAYEMGMRFRGELYNVILVNND